MGEKMSKLAELLEADKVNQGVFFQNLAVRTSIEALGLWEDPDENERVRRVLNQVQSSLIAARDRREFAHERERFDNMIRNYRGICEQAGIKLTNPENDNGQPKVEKREERYGERHRERHEGTYGNAVSKKYFQRSGELLSREKVVNVGLARMQYINRGGATMEICTRDERLPDLKRGDVVTIATATRSDKVRVKVKAVREYEDVNTLTRGEGKALKKWQPGLVIADVLVVLHRSFRMAEARDQKLVVFEFEKMI